VVAGIVAFHIIEGVAVSEKRFTSRINYFLEYVMDEDGLDVVGVAQFAHMKFDGYEVAFLDAVKGTGCFVEATSFLE
jgi:hypothetical protein